MQPSGSSPQPANGGEPKRRLFGSKREATTAIDPRMEAVIMASQKNMAARLEEGLRSIERAAISLMREVADEVWTVSGAGDGDGDGEGPSKIVEALARDQAIRGLVAHSDERFQSLDVRMARIEENLADITDAAAGLRETLGSRGGQATLMQLREAAERAAEPGDYWRDLNDRFARIEDGVAGVHEAAAELRTHLKTQKDFRYDALFERMMDLEDHLGAIARNTANISSPSIDTTTIEEAFTGLSRQLESIEVPGELKERLEAVQTYLVSAVQYLWERDRALAEWLKKTATLGNQTVRGEGERISQGIKAAEGRLLEAMSEKVRWLNTQAEQQGRVLGEALGVMEAKALGGLEGRAQEISDRLDTLQESARFTANELTESVGGRIAEMSERVQAATHAIREEVRNRSLGENGELIAGIDERLTRLSELVTGAMTWTAEQMGQTIREEIFRAVGSLHTDLGTDLETRLSASVGEQVSALARMIRSDNEALIQRLEAVEQQAAAKEAIRAVKELAASMPERMGEALDRRLRALADVFLRENRTTTDLVAKVGNALAERMDRTMDRTVITIGERFDREVNEVVDSIGDTMQNLASGFQRGGGRAARAQPMVQE